MPPKSKVDLYAAILRDVRAGMSNRALQRKHGVGFRTVKAALESVWPEPRKQLPPRKTRLDAFKPAIDQMLRVDLDAPRKQRHSKGYRRSTERLLIISPLTRMTRQPQPPTQYSTSPSDVRWWDLSVHNCVFAGVGSWQTGQRSSDGVTADTGVMPPTWRHCLRHFNHYIGRGSRGTSAGPIGRSNTLSGAAH